MNRTLGGFLAATLFLSSYRPHAHRVEHQAKRTLELLDEGPIDDVERAGVIDDRVVDRTVEHLEREAHGQLLLRARRPAVLLGEPFDEPPRVEAAALLDRLPDRAVVHAHLDRGTHQAGVA